MPERQEQIDLGSIYAKFGNPLEAKFAGQYLAVSSQGEIKRAISLLDVTKEANALGPQSTIFKIGNEGGTLGRVPGSLSRE